MRTFGSYRISFPNVTNSFLIPQPEHWNKDKGNNIENKVRNTISRKRKKETRININCPHIYSKHKEPLDVYLT